MKHELLVLRSLLVASLIVCGLILGNMLTYQGTPVQLAHGAQAAPGALSLVTAPACALPPDGIVCPRAAS